MRMVELDERLEFRRVSCLYGAGLRRWGCRENERLSSWEIARIKQRIMKRKNGNRGREMFGMRIKN